MDREGVLVVIVLGVKLSTPGVTVAKGLPKDQLEALALALVESSDKVQRALEGKPVKKVIVVPDRLVNLVA